MKSETKIAEENIENRKRQKGRNDWLGGKTMDLEIIGECKSHKASCQRFLEFLEETKKNNIAIVDNEDDETHIEEKITDLKNAIKKYVEAGI